jgi:uncharacterized protein (TIRG00374 family)
VKRHAKTIVGVVISVALLWWALRDVSPAQVLAELRAADPLLLTLAVVTATLLFPVRALRWRVLLAPTAPDVAFRPRFAAVNVGMAANNLIPARVGEFARAWVLSRTARVPLGAALGSLVIERLFDGLVLVGLLFVAMGAPGFPTGSLGGVDPRSIARGVALVVAAIGVVLACLVIAPVRSVAIVEAIAARVLPPALRRPLVDALHAFLGGLGVLRSPRLLALSAAWALGQWLLGAASYLLALRAFGIDGVGFLGSVFLQSLIGLAVAIPSSPGFFGPWEAAAKLGLGLWGVPAEKAISFAIGFHIGGFVPITVMGIWYAWRLDLRWKDVERSEQSVEERIEREGSGAAGPGAVRTPATRGGQRG